MGNGGDEGGGFLPHPTERGPGGNGLGGPRRRKIGRTGGPTVGRGSRGQVKMFITVYKRILW